MKGRTYPNINLENNLVNVVDSAYGYDELIGQLKTEYKTVKTKFKHILKTSYSFISKFLGDEE